MSNLDNQVSQPITAAETSALRVLLAQTQIRSVLEQYFYGLDARDEDVLRGCFTESCYYEANTGKGRQIRFDSAAQVAGTLVQLMARFKASLHLTSSPLIHITGDRATADVIASAHLAYGAPDAGGLILVRGVRYRDELLQVGGQWKIARRIHNTLWQYNASSIEPNVPPAPGIDR